VIKAIIFDCFGVLTESTYDRFYRTHLVDEPELVEQIKALDHASNKGSITMDDFYRGIAELTDMPETEIRAFMAQHKVNEELFAYIRTFLKPRYKIGFLSNVATNLMDELFTSKQQALFDDVVLSFEVKCAKPDIEIFELAAERLDLPAEECVFIDDVPRYVEAASIAGMKSILYTEFEDVKTKLEAML
jgi:putative hydrolase of the HAD superfamily